MNPRTTLLLAAHCALGASGCTLTENLGNRPGLVDGGASELDVAPRVDGGASRRDARGGESDTAKPDARTTAKDASDATFDATQEEASIEAGPDTFMSTPDVVTDPMPDSSLGDAPNGSECMGGIVCSNVCIPWWSDPMNCGWCGHDCQGTTCSNGQCAPQTVVSEFAGDYPIALDSNNVYFTSVQDAVPNTNNGVAVVPKTGGTPVILASYRFAQGLALDDTYVYLTDNQNGLVMRVPKDGSAAPATIATGSLGGPIGVAVDTTYAYYADSVANAVYRVAKDGSAAPTVLAQNESTPKQVLIDSSYVYFTNYQSGDLRRVALDGVGGAVTLGSAYANQIAAGSEYIFYGAQGIVGRVPKAGGGAQPMSSGLGNVIAITAQMDTLPYSASGGVLPGIATLTQGSSAEWAEGNPYSGSPGSELAMDDTFLYVVWLAEGYPGVLGRIAR